MTNRFVTIHGHFYQPPRENPWLEVVETEETARPAHDWNERITFECYRPNAYARIVDGNGRILSIVNNYASMSFNFGPTLLPYLEKHFPAVYQRILEADRQSLRRLGHGNAMGQVYNHIIMPLASERDQETEILWGIADFEKRFRRRPEALWLPETAVNVATLRALVRHGMAYLVLSPFQAFRVRPFGGTRWTEVSGGRIDPTHPYRCFLKDPSGKKRPDQFIDLFFYDGPISKDVSFADLLKDGNAFCDRFVKSHQSGPKRPQLIHIATDGETYGHHKKFGDMALAYALSSGFASRGIEVINYGAYLKRFPPVYEVEIDEGPKGEGTSWSCAHGVGRWKEDCGCSTGAMAGWNQKWRAPLREALNFLRDELALLYEREGAGIFKDAWEARNGYIQVILDRSPSNRDQFFERHGVRGLREEERLKGLKLLEMQRHGLQMFTSCGWFFADLAGIEAVLVLQHAARALELAEELGGQGLERAFLDHLARGRSNLAEKGNGEQVYRSLVKPKAVPEEQVVNHYVISSLFDDGEREKRLFSYRVERLHYEKVQRDDQLLALGEVRVTPESLPESKEFCFGLISSGLDIFRTWVAGKAADRSFDVLKERCLGNLEAGEEGLSRALALVAGGRFLTIRETPREGRQALLQGLLKWQFREHHGSGADLFDRTRQTLRLLAREGLEIPYEMRLAAEGTLRGRLLQEIRSLQEDFRGTLARGEIVRIIEEANECGFHLEKDDATTILNRMLIEKVETIRKVMGGCIFGANERADLGTEMAQEILLLVDLAEKSGFDLRKGKEEAQNGMYDILQEYGGNLEEAWWGGGVVRTLPEEFELLAEKLGFKTDRFPGKK